MGPRTSSQCLRYPRNNTVRFREKSPGTLLRETPPYPIILPLRLAFERPNMMPRPFTTYRTSAHCLSRSEWKAGTPAEEGELEAPSGRLAVPASLPPLLCSLLRAGSFPLLFKGRADSDSTRDKCISHFQVPEPWGLSGPAPQHLCTGPAQRCTLELPPLALAVPGGPRPGLLMSR